MNLSKLAKALVLFVFICEAHAVSTWLPWNWGKKKINGGWTEWTSWSSCQDKGLQTFRFKERSCTNPSPKNGGEICNGISRKTSPCKHCNRPLGLENSRITDKQLSASSWHEEFPPWNARLNANSAWCMGKRTQEIYLQIDLKVLTVVSAIASQGYHPDPSILSLRTGRVSKYRVAFSRDGSKWELYKNLRNEGKVFPGNDKRNGTKFNNLKPEIMARYIRIYPAGYFGFVCMRLELYGCRFNCGGYLTDSPGNISIASSRTIERDCLWQISLPSDTRKIFLDFVIFNVPCANGIVEIRSGRSVYGGAPILGQFCDISETPPHISDTGGKLWIRFKSNSSDSLVGFLAKYRPNCGKQLNATNTELKSLNFPGNYFHNLKCGWTIIANKGKIVLMKILKFDVTGDRDRKRCPDDHFSVRDGFDNGSPLIGRFCNSKRPPQFICSTGNALRIKFKSDDTIAGNGFHVTFREIEVNSTCADPISSSSSMIILPLQTSSMLPSQLLTPSLTLSSVMINSTKNLQLFNSNETSVLLRLDETPAQLMTSLLHFFNQSSVNASSLNTSGGEVMFAQRPDGNSHKKDDNSGDDDDDDGALTTIIIISVFSFIVLCMVIATVTPNIIHLMAKRKQRRQKEMMSSCGASAEIEDGTLDREGCELIPMLPLHGESQTPQEGETTQPEILCGRHSSTESNSSRHDSLSNSTASLETEPNREFPDDNTSPAAVSSLLPEQGSFTSNRSSFEVEANGRKGPARSDGNQTPLEGHSSCFLNSPRNSSEISQDHDCSTDEEIATISQSPVSCSSQVSQDSLSEVTSCDLEYDTTDLNFAIDENMDVSLGFAEEMQTVLSNFMKNINPDSEEYTPAEITSGVTDTSVEDDLVSDISDDSKNLCSRTESTDTPNEDKYTSDSCLFENRGVVNTHESGELGQALTDLQSTLTVSSDSDVLCGHIQVKALSDTEGANKDRSNEDHSTESDNSPLWELQPDWKEKNGNKSQSDKSLKTDSLGADTDASTAPYTLCFNENKDSGCPSSTSTDNIPSAEDFLSPTEPCVRVTRV